MLIPVFALSCIGRVISSPLKSLIRITFVTWTCRSSSSWIEADCEVNLKLKDQLWGDKRIVIEDDATLLKYFRENGVENDDYIHLFVEKIENVVGLLLECQGNDMESGDIDSIELVDEILDLDELSDFNPNEYGVDVFG
ncbi:hypothetical protein VNO77_24822 [Canavalia gladiata]|uniref:Uncharacterized protein n=1 Tax=Canavalia gladiata TaxID=3824 RepID=A0AAN9LAF3_CANGL